MKLDPFLTRAVRLIRRGKAQDAVHKLEVEVTRYRDSFVYLYIVGQACLRAGDFGGAFTYFNRARSFKMRDPRSLLGLAALYLRRMDTGKAVELYLEVQELDQGNRAAKKALGIIRRHSGADDFSLWVSSNKLARLFPPLPHLPPSLRSVLITVAAALLALLIGAGILLRARGVELFPGKSPREGLAGTLLEGAERHTPVQVDGSFRYILTNNQVLDLYDGARELFDAYRDEKAKVSLNKILESNASEAVKNKARLLISYMVVPGFDSLKDRFSYAEVAAEPVLYRDCYLIWRGRAANIIHDETSTAFNLLVGYDTGNTLEGVVPVVFNFAVPLNPDRPLEVLGRLVPVVSSTGIDIRLEGVAVHQTGLLEGGGQ
ncbi:MAG: tetratricopeptide repeat protein [Treponema sp.]|jgi:tetratricopeptide (TPR) repeat protein|nr:tetratricopeptide repeat protein [Treponema sp.]